MSPNWDFSSSRRGGDTSDVPLPHTRYFPHPRRKKRVVTYWISTFAGLTPGARHYYASYEEEENPLWNPAPAGHREGPVGWQISWDDAPEHKGRRGSKRLCTEEAAVRWVRREYDRYFGGPGYRLKKRTRM